MQKQRMEICNNKINDMHKAVVELTTMTVVLQQ